MSEERLIHYALFKLGSFPLFKFLDYEVLLQALSNWLSGAKVLDSDVAQWVAGDGSTVELRFRSGVVRRFSLINPYFPLIFFEQSANRETKDADVFKIIPVLAVPRET